MLYQLYYWPGLQGRGEFVRLAFEEAGQSYVDVALLSPQHGGGEEAVVGVLDDPAIARPPFAPPFLQAGGRLIGQTANILLYLGGRLRLAPHDEAGRLWVHQLQLTIADLTAEIHDTHHPIASGLYYEQQKQPAQRRAHDFLANRLPKFLEYFEQVARRNPGRGHWLAATRLTYADLSMAQVIAGLRYAFPGASRRALRHCGRLRALHDAVFARPRVRRYLASGRRVPFNNDGIFRHYPELDG